MVNYFKYRITRAEVLEMHDFLKTVRYNNWYTTKDAWKTYKPINYFPTPEYATAACACYRIGQVRCR